MRFAVGGVDKHMLASREMETANNQTHVQIHTCVPALHAAMCTGPCSVKSLQSFRNKLGHVCVFHVHCVVCKSPLCMWVSVSAKQQQHKPNQWPHLDCVRPPLQSNRYLLHSPVKAAIYYRCRYYTCCCIELFDYTLKHQKEWKRKKEKHTVQSVCALLKLSKWSDSRHYVM